MQKLIEYIKDIGKIEKKRTSKYTKREQIISGVQTKNMVSEDLDVTQGKLVLGFRTGEYLMRTDYIMGL